MSLMSVEACNQMYVRKHVRGVCSVCRYGGIESERDRERDRKMEIDHEFVCICVCLQTHLCVLGYAQCLMLACSKLRWLIQRGESFLVSDTS